MKHREEFVNGGGVTSDGVNDFLSRERSGEISKFRSQKRA